MTDRRARLFERVRGGERLDLHAGVDNARERRMGLEVDAEEAGPRGLAREADVADGRLLAAAEAAGHAVVRQMALDRVERFGDPVADPFQSRRLVELELVLEVSADARDPQRMGIAGGGPGDAGPE